MTETANNLPENVFRHIVDLAGNVHHVPLMFYRWNRIFRQLEKECEYELIDPDGNHNGNVGQDISILILHSFRQPLLFENGHGKSLLVLRKKNV